MSQFYVYELSNEDGIQYVGKGSGRRLKNQERRFGLSGRIVAEFAKEPDAYAFEVSRIAELNPPLNKCKGGNGSRAIQKRHRKTAWEMTFERIGSRRYAALLLLHFSRLLDPSKVDQIRRVAHG
jgi:hypothetical protein